MGIPYQVVFYKTPKGKCPTREFLNALDDRVRAKVFKWIELLEEQGPHLPRPYADVVEGPIRELRIGFGHLEIRLLYFFFGRTGVVVTHGFLKKSRALSVSEIHRAVTTREKWLKNHGGD